MPLRQREGLACLVDGRIVEGPANASQLKLF